MENLHKDATDYLIHEGNSVEKLLVFEKEVLREAPKPKIDISQFKPITVTELIEILGLTIKKDETNKLIAFLGMTTVYTEDSQLNISFNAPSSTGKSYIPTEVSRLFPEEDVMEMGYTSPTAFFHDTGKYNKEKNEILIDLSRKILIFLDQPHTQLLERLRPVLSHDSKELKLRITDKNQKGGMITKNVVIRGFPVVIFCTVGLNIDEQESTRFILLSPETSQEKIREAIHEKVKKETDKGAYKNYIEKIPERKILKERIEAIKQENIKDIILGDPCLLEELFFKKNKNLKPRHQRDVGRLISLVKAFALINCWFREREEDSIIANADDVNAAFSLWETISESQELNIPPYIYKIFQEVILPAYAANMRSYRDAFGLERKEISNKHFDVYGRLLGDPALRLQILPALENAGLIYQELHPKDKRKKLVYPTVEPDINLGRNNSVEDQGVE